MTEPSTPSHAAELAERTRRFVRDGLPLVLP